MTENKIIIREMKPTEFNILKELLYEAIFQLPDEEPYPREVINEPEIYVYIKDFGNQDDLCLLAELDGTVAGGVWTRILAGDIKGYGNIDEYTPEFAISLFPQYRNQGIGTKLMLEMIELLRSKGYQKTSLSVQKENYAVKMYERVGFKIVSENEDDYLMLLELN